MCKNASAFRWLEKGDCVNARLPLPLTGPNERRMIASVVQSVAGAFSPGWPWQRTAAKPAVLRRPFLGPIHPFNIWPHHTSYVFKTMMSICESPTLQFALPRPAERLRRASKTKWGNLFCMPSQTKISSLQRGFFGLLSWPQCWLYKPLARKKGEGGKNVRHTGNQLRNTRHCGLAGGNLENNQP